jgi:two-component system, sensor histidine kinase PdtaS
MSIRKWSICVLLLWCELANAQNNSVDSLQYLLEETKDREQRFSLLSQLSEKFLSNSPEKALEYGERLMELATLKEDHKWTTRAYHLIGESQLKIGNTDKAESTYLKALNYEFSFEPIDQEKMALAEYNFGIYYRRTGRYREALIHFNESFLLEKELSNKKKQAMCMLNIGVMYMNLGVNDSANIYFIPAKKLAIEIRDTSTLQSIFVNTSIIHETKGEYLNAMDELNFAEVYSKSDYDLAYVYGNRGRIFYYQGKVDSAIFYYNKAADYFEKSGNELEQGMNLVNIGILLMDQGNLTRAETEYKKAEAIFEKAKNNYYLGSVYINIAQIHNEKKDTDSSYYYYEKALILALETNSSIHIGTIYQSLGILDDIKGDYVKAANRLEKSHQIFMDLGYKRSIAENHYAFSDVYIHLKNYSKAEGYLNKALLLAKQVDNVDLRMNVYDKFIKLYALRNNKEELYKYHAIQLAMQDSLRSIDNFNAVEEISAKYGLKEKGDSILYQQIQLSNQVAINKQRSTLLWLSLIAGGIFLVMTILLFISRKKVNIKNTENELLLGEIHHRVKNNLQVISSLLSLQERNITDETAKAAILEGKERVQSMGLIHKMLYQQNNFSGINMSEYIEKLISGLLDSFGKKSEEFTLNYDIKGINLDVDTAIPLGLIINELVVNALKHAYSITKEPKINVNLKEINSQLVLQVEDNGTGVVADVQSSESFGMKLVNSLSRQLRGTIDIEQKDGLCFKIAINDYKLIA